MTLFLSLLSIITSRLYEGVLNALPSGIILKLNAKGFSLILVFYLVMMLTELPSIIQETLFIKYCRLPV